METRETGDSRISHHWCYLHSANKSCWRDLAPLFLHCLGLPASLQAEHPEAGCVRHRADVGVRLRGDKQTEAVSGCPNSTRSVSERSPPCNTSTWSALLESYAGRAAGAHHQAAALSCTHARAHSVLRTPPSKAIHAIRPTNQVQTVLFTQMNGPNALLVHIHAHARTHTTASNW